MAETEKQNGAVPDTTTATDSAKEGAPNAKVRASRRYLPPPRMPGVPAWEDRIRDLRQLTLRDDDVILFTYPKTGTHWLWETISMLRKGSAEYDKNTKVQFMMEFVQNFILDEQPSPRTLNTHLPFSMLPVPEMKARRLKAVHVYRNPKDTCVSMYHMARSSPRMFSSVPAKTFDDFVEYYFFSDKQIFGSYVGYLQRMHAFQRDNPEVPMVNLSFEDVKKDPVGSVKKLASFLGVAASDALCAQIAEECSFDKMKAKAEEKARPTLHAQSHVKENLESMKRNMPVIYRKGQVGDWKNYFTVAMSERVDQLLQEELKALPFPMTFQ